MDMEKIFQNTKSFILNALLILFPFFFLPFTQEYFITNKFYLLGLAVILLLLLTISQPLLTKKLSWTVKPLDMAIILFALSVGVSIIFSSPNKIQALLNLNFGLVMITILTVLYFYLSRIKIPSTIYHLTSNVLSLTTIIFFFQPFKNISLPAQWQFLKNPHFNPIGSQLDLAILLGFFLIIHIMQILKQGRPQGFTPTRSIIYYLSSIILSLIALFLTIYSLLQPTPYPLQPNLILPPFRLSWYAALEVLKNAKTAIFGVGVNNFSSVFTRVKDFFYNQSPLWQIASFNVSANLPLHLLAETGILGLLSFVFLVISAIRQFGNLKIKSFIWLFVYLLICSLILPPSLLILFLFFITLGLLQTDEGKKIEIENENLSTIYAFSFLVFLAIIAAGSYFLGKSYLAELYFKKAAEGVINNNIKTVYDNIKKARILNPYEEKYILNFAQTNFLIASNLATKEKDKITDQDKQTITQAIQTAISEGKTLISLHPEKAEYYENLANIYRNIIAMAQGADLWTISSYQRAIVLDPVNPSYRISLGGIYYLLGRYTDAISLFEQVVSLKPDWPNAHYNLAWADYQGKNYQRAVNEMQNVLTLLNPQKDKTDYDKAKKDLEEFKKKLPQEEKEATSSADEKQPSQLTLPSPPAQKIEPKIKLPKEASPEAKINR